MPQTDLGYLDFLLSEVIKIFGFLEIFEFLLAEMRCVPIDSDAAIRSVGAPWIVSKVLVVIARVRSGLVGQK